MVRAKLPRPQPQKEYMREPNEDIDSPQRKIVQLRKDLSARLVDRDAEIALTLTALFSRSSLLLVGPPGTAKSYTLESVFKQVTGAKGFVWLMGKFTEPDEVYGAVDILALKNGVRRRITADKLPECHWAFLDEFWKASTAIANTLLRVVNERVYNNGEGDRPVPLKVLVAASNEYPQDGELGAMFDRFLLRKEVTYVKGKANRRRLLLYNERSSILPPVSVTLSLAEIDAGIAEADALPVSEQTLERIERILDKLNEEGIFPSDRRTTKILSVVKAAAYVMGADSVKPEHLTVLSHMLWTEPGEQIQKVHKIVARTANPVGFQITELLQEADSVLAGANPKDAWDKLKDIRQRLEDSVPEDPHKDEALRQVDENINECAEAVRSGTMGGSKSCRGS